jgi:hypothetical protein
MRLPSGAGLAVTALAAGIALPVYAAAAGAPSVRLAGSTGAAGIAAGIAPGNPHGYAYVPPAARAVSTSHPDQVVGHGTAASCTSRAVVAAVAAGGVITFSCGPAPVTIVMRATAKVRNTSRRVVLDGRGKVTLSGGGARRILYLNACDPAQGLTNWHCHNQARPQLVVQNLTFADGNARGSGYQSGSGGAIYAQGGQLKVVNSRFIGNRCYASGPDLGGAAIRVLDQYQGGPVYIVHSTFSGGVCSNGGALSSLGVSWVVLNSVMTRNKAIGWGANPAARGTRGGGSGGAMYGDGDLYNVRIINTVMSHNYAREGAGAIFFVSNNYTGTLHIRHSTLSGNPSGQFHTPGYPGIFYHSRGHPIVIDSTINLHTDINEGAPETSRPHGPRGGRPLARGG